MEGRSLMGNNGEGGVVKLPIGFRFRPTDEELLFHYLKRKALSLPLPAPVILDFDVFASHPCSLPGDVGEKRRYYFYKGKGLGSKGTHFTSTGCGFWKTNGKVKQIVASSSSSCDVLGTRKLWAFYHKDSTKSGPLGWSRTPWVLHELQLPSSTSARNPDGQKQEWEVCRVFQRKRYANKNNAAPRNYNCGGSELPSYIDFKLEEKGSELGPPEPCSSGDNNA